MNSEEPSDKENTKSATSQAKSLPTRSSHVLNLEIKQIGDSCRKHAPEENPTRDSEIKSDARFELDLKRQAKKTVSGD